MSLVGAVEGQGITVDAIQASGSARQIFALEAVFL